MLNTDTVTPYLLAQKLVDKSAIIDGELRIFSAARRNRNLRVEEPVSGGYLLKQPDDSLQESYATVQNEAAFYTYCRHQFRNSRLKDFLPEFVCFDAERNVLVLRLVQNVKVLWQHYWNYDSNHFPLEVPRQLGEGLALLHRSLRSKEPAMDVSAFRPKHDIPWIMLVHKPGREVLAELSVANYETLCILQGQADLTKQLDRLRYSWQPDTVIHNDVRGDNVLVLQVPEGQKETDIRIRIVDWEMAQIGDPAWDLAGVLQDFVLFWIASLPVAKVTSIEEAISQARYPWEVIKSAIRNFWTAYYRSLKPNAGDAIGLLLRGVSFSAARLIQSAYEMSSRASRLAPQAVLLLQISANILNEPELSQVQFYGIPSTFRK
jgi:hypothetical protein